VSALNCRATNGTLAYITGTPASTGVTFTIINSPTINNLKALDCGGMIWASNVNLALVISNIIVKTFSAVNEGGLIWTDQIKSISIKLSEFETFKANNAGSLLKSNYSGADIELITNIIRCDVNPYNPNND
jgi:hypothetical protein